MRYVFANQVLPLCLGILGLALVGCGGGPAAPRPEPQATPEPAPAAETRTLILAAGAETAAELAGGERHVYDLELAAGQFADLIVDQRGIDVTVSLHDHDGRPLTRVDSPNGSRGPEPLPVVAENPLSLHLEVASPDPRNPPGRYAVIVAQLRPATARDRDRVAAERAFAAAEGLRRRPDGESRRTAVARYEEVLASFRALGDRGRQADVLDRVGRTCLQLDEAAPAIAAYEQALPIFRELGRGVELGNALNHLGAVYRSLLGRPQEAIPLYEEALEIHRSLGRRGAEATTLGNLGRACDSLGELEEALHFYEQAVKIQEELDDRGGLGLTLSNMGLLYVKLGKPQQAIAILERALDLLEQEGRVQQAGIALTYLGWAYGESNQPQRELDHLQRALARLRQAGSRRELAVTLNNLGCFYYQLDRLEEALAAFREVLKVFHELGDRHSEAVALANLGRLRTRLGEPDVAVQLYLRALPLYVAAGDRDGEATARFGLAHAHRGRGDLAASQAEIDQALERIEGLRAEPASPQLRSVFLASKQDFYGFYVDLLMARHEHDPAAGYDAGAFEVSERARARSLLDLMAEADVELRRGVLPELLAREAELGQRLEAAEQRRHYLEQEGAGPGRLTTVEEQLRELLLEFDRLQAEIRRKSPPPLGEPARLPEIRQQVLDDRALLVEYTLGAERSFVWAVTPDSVTSFELPPRADVEKAARDAHHLLANSHRRLARGQADLALGELSRMLLLPVADQLAGRPLLLIIPDGALHYIPFAALPIPRRSARPPGTELSASRPLIAEHEVVTLPSASTLVELRRDLGHRRRPAATLAVVADPVFDAADPRLATRFQRPETPAGGQRDDGAAPQRWPRLPLSGDEARAIVELVPPGERYLEALGFAASRSVLDELGEYRMLHFATHGFFDSVHPELSGVALATIDEEGRPQEGYLRAWEIYRLDLAADLVVLSACQTALGPEVRGEGLVGLTRAFMVAGARRVVVSLWPVEDRATAELMRGFYREILAAGRSPAAALRRAQLELRQQEGWQAPYYWAGFVLHGDPG